MFSFSSEYSLKHPIVVEGTDIWCSNILTQSQYFSKLEKIFNVTSSNKSKILRIFRLYIDDYAINKKKKVSYYLYLINIIYKDKSFVSDADFIDLTSLRETYESQIMSEI